VHDPLSVRRVERVRDLGSELDDLVERQRPLLQAVGERFALEQLHDEEVRLALVADVEQRADVRMVEGGDRLRLALEALPPILVLSEARGKQLDRNAAVKAGVASPPYFAHAAGADRRLKLVRPEPRASLQGHGLPEYSRSGAASFSCRGRRLLAAGPAATSWRRG
jgi:hypothetical protein